MGEGIGFEFFKKLKSLPNVRIYSSIIDGKNLYKNINCLAVAIIAGTLGLEAAMERVPVFIFGRPIFYVAECFIKPKNFTEFFQIVMAIIRNQYKFDENSLYAILQALQDSASYADVDLTKAKNWLELGYMGNFATANYIHDEYINSIVSR